jgi:5,10-methylenetetrahydromethanopterin reductase
VSAVRSLLAGGTLSTEGRYVRLREVALDHPPVAAPLVSIGVRGPKGLELSGRCADGTVLDSLSSPAYVRWARERIDAGRSAAGRTDPHRLTVYAYCATDAASRAAVERLAEDLRGAGGPQGERLGAEVPVALSGRDDAYVRAIGEAGADCVVLLSPDPAVPLDLTVAT